MSSYGILFCAQNKTFLISKVAQARSGHDILASSLSILKSSTQDKRPNENRLDSLFFLDPIWIFSSALEEHVWRRLRVEIGFLDFFYFCST